MNYSAAHYRDLADYDALILPVRASIAPLAGGGLERWYINKVIRRTYLAATRVGFVCRDSTSGGTVMLQKLPPRPVSPVGRPVRPTLDKFGHPLPPLPRRLSKLNILRRVRPVLLAVRAARDIYFATALAQYGQTLRRAADPRAAQAARLKQCAEYLFSLKRPLSIIATGQTPDQAGQFEKLPGGQCYYFPMGWPLKEIARLSAEIQLFVKLHFEFEASVLAQFLDTPAHPTNPTPDTAPVADPTGIWATLLCPKVQYPLSALDGLLVSVGLLNDAASCTPTPDFKGSAVLGVIHALRKRKYLQWKNSAALARLLAERYGNDVANYNTVARGTGTLPGPAEPVYSRTLALLPAPTLAPPAP